MNRIQKMTVRLNDIESQALRKSADDEHISVSEYVRNLIKGKSMGGTTTPPLESIINNHAHTVRPTETTDGSAT